MYFSIIIPTYNPKKYLPKLLSSIARNKCVDNIEVIISDDCSDEPFDDILSSFTTLHIEKISNDIHTGFPKDGRQHGAEVATGEWLCFADQDDYFVDNAFDKIKQFISENNVSNYLTGNFIVHNTDTDEYVLVDSTKAWTHGKFYEKVFWDKYNLKYDDVKYCEDTNLSTKVGCILITENVIPKEYNEPIYIWEKRSDSLSSNNYFLKSMPDYVKGTVSVIIDNMEKHKYDSNIIEKLAIKFIQTMYHIYFYYQSNELWPNKKEMFETLSILIPIFEKFKEITNTTSDDLINKTENDFCNLYSSTRLEDCGQVPFLEKITFREWIYDYLG